MNEKSTKLTLLELTKDDHPFGNVQGREVFRKLLDYVDAHPQSKIFGISLAGIVATDASFPRESVIAVAKQLRGEKGFYLEDFADRDVIDNWKYAASAKDQPLVIWRPEGYEVLGPEISSSVEALLNYVLSNGTVSAAQVAKSLDMSVQNASTRLKKLVEQGYIMRSEMVSESGGIEYLYQSIK